ncbi:hypothetical protein N7451_012837 [Penicillium sp. IBT 35674x]|nr:hypothetical protein N7451_012837 [Penicillium sp. IBT 35674x]
MFCSAEDGDQVDERVILRGVAGKRDTRHGASCYICPTGTALDAFYRPPRDLSLRAAERSEETVATDLHDRAVDMDAT